MNFALQARKITAVIVWGYVIASRWADYQGLKQGA